MILVGDSLDKLSTLEDESVDAVVTDPPYGLSFMGKNWDKALPNPRIWKECLRVLKPGGHLIAFGAPRIYHRLAVQIEDSGFDIRDCLMWVYGSGFPKSHDVSKAIDKAAGAKREVVAPPPYTRGKPVQKYHEGRKVSWDCDPQPITAPSTDLAKQWDGWGTALKPAYEPILLARKKLRGTVAQNVTEYGTGALNIDASRVGTESTVRSVRGGGTNTEQWRTGKGNTETGSSSGRWPANLILDEIAGTMLDEQTGELTSGAMKNAPRKSNTSAAYGKHTGDRGETKANSGGASRFFYCAKASRARS